MASSNHPNDDPVLQAYQRGGLTSVAAVIRDRANGDAELAAADLKRCEQTLHDRERARLEREDKWAPRPDGAPGKSSLAISHVADRHIDWLRESVAQGVQQDHDRAIEQAARADRWESWGMSDPAQKDNHGVRDGQGNAIAHLYPTSDVGKEVNERSLYTLDVREFGSAADDQPTSTHHLTLDEAFKRGDAHVDAYLQAERESREKLLRDFRDAADPRHPPGGGHGRPGDDSPPPPRDRDRGEGGVAAIPPGAPRDGEGGAARPFAPSRQQGDGDSRSAERLQPEQETPGQRMVREMKERHARQRERGLER